MLGRYLLQFLQFERNKEHQGLSSGHHMNCNPESVQRSKQSLPQRVRGLTQSCSFYAYQSLNEMASGTIYMLWKLDWQQTSTSRQQRQNKVFFFSCFCQCPTISFFFLLFSCTSTVTTCPSLRSSFDLLIALQVKTRHGIFLNDI